MHFFLLKATFKQSKLHKIDIKSDKVMEQVATKILNEEKK